jgi:hypothetical protein
LVFDQRTELLPNPSAATADCLAQVVFLQPCLTK